jgi:enediyne biosynthesis thioesterase
MRAFEYRLAVSFSETNLVGNVYFANYFLWQGKCREEFLRLHAPRVIQDFKAGFGMITKESSCVYHQEAFAFQEILIRMTLAELTRTSIEMLFEYFRVDAEPMRTLIAEGRQKAIWVTPQHTATVIPSYLYEAVERFARGTP